MEYDPFLPFSPPALAGRLELIMNDLLMIAALCPFHFHFDSGRSQIIACSTQCQRDKSEMAMKVLDVRRLTLQVQSLSASLVRKLEVLMRKRRRSTLES